MQAEHSRGNHSSWIKLTLSIRGGVGRLRMNKPTKAGDCKETGPLAPSPTPQLQSVHNQCPQPQLNIQISGDRVFPTILSKTPNISKCFHRHLAKEWIRGTVYHKKWHLITDEFINRKCRIWSHHLNLSLKQIFVFFFYSEGHKNFKIKT